MSGASNMHVTFAGRRPATPAASSVRDRRSKQGCLSARGGLASAIGFPAGNPSAHRFEVAP